MISVERRFCLLLVLSAVILFSATLTRAQSPDQSADQVGSASAAQATIMRDPPEPALSQTSQTDPALPLLVQIADAQKRLVDEAGSNATPYPQRVAKLISLRESIIARFPADERVPIWESDLAFDLLFVRGGMEGADLCVEYGVASPVDERAFAANARRAADLMVRAGIGLNGSIQKLETKKDFATNVKLQQQQRQLIQFDQKQRFPFIEITAEYQCLLGGMADGSIDAANAGKQWNDLAQRLSPLLLNLDEPWRSRARCMMGCALVRSGRGGESKTYFGEVLDRTDDDPVTHLRACLGMIELASATGGTKAAEREIGRRMEDPRLTHDPFAYLLLCDQLYRNQAKQPASGLIPGRNPSGEELSARLVKACRAYGHYLKNETLPLTHAQRQEVVQRRYEILAPDNVPDEQLPAPMALARAQRWAATPATRHKAVQLTDSIILRDPHDASIIPQCLWLKASILAADENGVHDVPAAQCLMQLAQDFPLDAKAPAAAAAAAQLLLSKHHQTREDLKITRALEESLTLLTTRFAAAGDAGRWHYERALLLLEQSQPKQAVSALKSIDPLSNYYTDAQVRLALTQWEILSQPEAKTQPEHDSYEEILAQVDRASSAVTTEQKKPGLSTDRGKVLDYDAAVLRVLAGQVLLKMDQPAQVIERLNNIESDDALPADMVAQAIDLRVKALEREGATSTMEDSLKALVQHSPIPAISIINRVVSRRLDQYAGDAWPDPSAQTVKAVGESVMPLAELGFDTCRAHLIDAGLDTSTVQTSELLLAEAQRIGGKYGDALTHYQSLRKARPDWAPALIGEAECLYRLKRYAEAMPQFQQLSARLQTQSASTIFWVSELRMLQILDAVNQNTAQICPRIARLRLTDANLGGDAFRPAIIQLEQKYKPH